MKPTSIQTLILLLPSITAFSFGEGPSSLKAIIGSRAIASTIFNEVNNELIKENILTYELINNSHKLETTLFYGLTFILSIYLQYSYFTYIEKRWSGVEMFSNIQEKTKWALFIFTSVFTKGIENAT
jgi:hypothetical protein